MRLMRWDLRTTLRRAALLLAVVLAAGCASSPLPATEDPHAAAAARAWHDDPPKDAYEWRRKIHEDGPPPFPGSVNPND